MNGANPRATSESHAVGWQAHGVYRPATFQGGERLVIGAFVFSRLGVNRSSGLGGSVGSFRAE